MSSPHPTGPVSGTCPACLNTYRASCEEALFAVLYACLAGDTPRPSDAREWTTQDRWHLFGVKKR